MTRSDFAKNLWRWKCGLPEQGPEPAVDLDELRRTEWSPEFETFMRNRLVIGALRYGRLGAENKPQYNRVEACRHRLDLYESTGNMEHLVDVANLMLCEFVECGHPLAHFAAVDDGEHVGVKK